MDTVAYIDWENSRQYGDDPLGFACTNGQFQIAKYLVKRGADLYQIRDGYFRTHEVVDLLLDLGMHPNLRVGDSQKLQSVLSFVADHAVDVREADGEVERLVEKLMVFGAKPNELDLEFIENAADEDDEYKQRGYSSNYPDIIGFLDTVRTWSWLRIAAACKRPDLIEFVLANNRFRKSEDPSKLSSSAAAATVMVAAATGPSPWDRDAASFDSVRIAETVALVRAAMRPWGPTTHRLFHKRIREAVTTLLLVSARLGRPAAAAAAAFDGGGSAGGSVYGCGGPPRASLLPTLPIELILAIATNFGRFNWPRDD